MHAAHARSDAYCPHCHLLVVTGAQEPWPPSPLNCPHCRLLIAAGRALTEPPSEPGARGAAAGVFSSRAKRGSEGPPARKEDIVAGIRRVAELVGERPQRLLMVDYQQRCAGSSDLPALSDVLAVYGSWKTARRAAARN